MSVAFLHVNVTLHLIFTCAVLARSVEFTLVDLNLAVLPNVARQTFTGVIVDTIDALAVDARTAFAFVDVDLAVDTWIFLLCNSFVI